MTACKTFISIHKSLALHCKLATEHHYTHSFTILQALAASIYQWNSVLLCLKHQRVHTCTLGRKLFKRKLHTTYVTMHKIHKNAIGYIDQQNVLLQLTHVKSRATNM